MLVPRSRTRSRQAWPCNVCQHRSRPERNCSSQRAHILHNPAQQLRSTHLSLILLNSSIVVLAEAHNATILHPEFLKNQGIVPRDLQPIDNPICTPALSIVRYRDLAFTADSAKLQLLATSDVMRSALSRIAARYVEVLPHVHYTAVGLNFVGYIRDDQPEQWLENRFFRSADKADVRGHVAGARFSYPERDAACSWEVGQVQGSTGPAGAVIVNSNYNFNLNREQPSAAATSAFGSLADCEKHFREVVAQIEER